MAGLRSNALKLLTLLCLAASAVSAQVAQELGDQALNAKVTELVQQNQFLQARPFLLEMQTRMKDLDNQDNMEAIAFFLASSYLQEYQETKKKEALQTAVKSFEEYIAKYASGPRKIIALLNLGDAYSDLKEFEKAINTYSTIYNSSTTSGSVRNDIRRVIAKTYLKTDKPEAGMPYYQEAYDLAVLDEEAKAEAATWLLQAYLAKGEIDAIIPYFNNLTGRKAALFNPKFNVTLIKAGDKLFEEGNYDFAILFYAIIKRKDDIVAFYEQAVRQLELALSYKAEGAEDAIAIEKRLREAEANLKAVRGIREYDADVRWRSARVLLESQRTWEALWSFYNLMLDYPDHEQAEEFLFLAFSQARVVKDDYMVVQLAKDYLSRDNYKKYRGQITLDLATYYQDQGDDKAFYELVTTYLDETMEDDRVAAQLSNLLSVFLLDNERYAELYKRMDRYNRTSDNFDLTKEASKYWASLALTISADYERALESYNQFIDEYADRSVFSEDAYYRRAICLYGTQNQQKAYAEFTAFVKSYPKSTRRGEAELYLGDIKREANELDEALAHYRLVEDYSSTMTFVTKATFAISELLEVKNEDEKAAKVLLTYIERYGENAELDEAYLRLGRFEQRRGNLAQRFEYNQRGLDSTANNPNRYAADQILIEYVLDYPRFVTNYEAAVKLIEAMLDDKSFQDSILKDRTTQYKFFQSEEGQKVDPNLYYKIARDRAFRVNLLRNPEKLLNELRTDYIEKLEALVPYKPEDVFSKLLANAKEPKTVLELRIAMAQDILSDSELIFRFTDEQVMSGSPAVMLWRAKKIRTLNPAKANALLETSLEKHPYAPRRGDTLLLIAEIALDKAMADPTKENLQVALDKYDTIIELFGMRAEGGAPFLAKGEILIKLGREEDALKVLSNILRNPDWRGEPQAKAHLQLGLAYYSMERYAESHAYFERLMLGFGGFRDEVALAFYWDLKALEAMDEAESVQQLIEEIRTREDLKETEGYRLIEENYAL